MLRWVYILNKCMPFFIAKSQQRSYWQTGDGLMLNMAGRTNSLLLFCLTQEVADILWTTGENVDFWAIFL